MFLCNEIKKYFGLTKSSPAHITIKSPFEADEAMLAELECLLDKFSASNNMAPLVFSGIGSFDREVVFVDAYESTDAKNLIGLLDTALKSVSWLKYGEFDLNRKLHATLVHGEKTKEKFDEIMSLLSEEKFEYNEWFDNIAILKKEDGFWKIYKEYKLK